MMIPVIESGRNAAFEVTRNEDVIMNGLEAISEEGDGRSSIVVRAGRSHSTSTMTAMNPVSRVTFGKLRQVPMVMRIGI